jgi:hypothetical protein
LRLLQLGSDPLHTADAELGGDLVNAAIALPQVIPGRPSVFPVY